MPKERYLTLEETLHRLFEENSDDDKGEIDHVVVPPKVAEPDDKEKVNDTILNKDTNAFICDTAG